MLTTNSCSADSTMLAQQAHPAQSVNQAQPAIWGDCYCLDTLELIREDVLRLCERAIVDFEVEVKLGRQDTPGWLCHVVILYPGRERKPDADLTCG